jgi:hypothetical protein
MRKNILLLTAMMLAFATLASADTLNHNPSLTPPAPILNGGWAYDQVNQAFVPSIDSPYLYNLAAVALFTITDDFVMGDVYQVFDFGALILTTLQAGAMPPFGAGDPWGWTHAGYMKGQVLLAPGPHFLVVMGNGAGGLPAGFFTRIDSVPEPSSILLLAGGIVGSALAALAVSRRKR